MKPQDFTFASNECCARKLKDITVFLERAFQAKSATCGICAGATLAQARGGQKYSPPGGAFEAHRAVASVFRIRNADLGYAVAPAEPRRLFCGALYHADHAHGAFLEFRQGLAQLHEGVRIKRSTKMAQPEDERGARGPKLREPLRFAGGQIVSELRGRVADF